MTVAMMISLGVLVLVVVGLTLTATSPDMVLLGGLVVLLVTGTVSPAEALGGFSNEGLVTIGALFVVAEGVRQTGGIAFVGLRVLGAPRGRARSQLRLMAPAAALSAFLNNTPVVAMMIPVVNDWARRRRLSLSQLLMPLSYASILGGLVTLVGTSTTLVVNGLLLATPGQRGLTMFELAWVGLPITAVGLAYVPLVSPWLLPPRTPARDRLDDSREYVVQMLVARSSPVVGRTIEGAGLRSLPGMYLMKIQRADQTVVAARPSTRIHAGDRLTLVGGVESVVDLQKIPGLCPATEQLLRLQDPRSARVLVEAVVGSHGRLAGLTVRESAFRTRHNAVIIAVARDGERVHKKIGDIRLRAGDTLLIEGPPSFVVSARGSRDFLLVSSVEDSTPVAHDRAFIARGLLLMMVGLVVVEASTMLVAASLAGLGMVLTGCLRPAQAKRAIDWGVLLGIGSGLGIAAALAGSGAAELVARWLVGAAGHDPLAALVAIYVATTVLANLVTTKAAAVLLFPVAQAAAEGLGVSFMPFAITLIVAAAAAFATPVGYQTNLMVYGPGGYRSVDFLRMGGPLSVLVGMVTVVVVPIAWPF